LHLSFYVFTEYAAFYINVLARMIPFEYKKGYWPVKRCLYKAGCPACPHVNNSCPFMDKKQLNKPDRPEREPEKIIIHSRERGERRGFFI
jgi:hypothetical protein